MVFLLLVAGAVIFWSGNKRLDKTLKIIGLTVALLAILWGIVSWFVDTDREIVMKQTRQFVDAVVRRDMPTMTRLLHPKASMVMWNRDNIITGAKVYSDLYGLKGAHITGMDVEDDKTQITVNFAVFSEHDAAVVPATTVNSTWQFGWVDTTDGWRLMNLVPLKIGNLDQTGAQRQYFERKPK